MDYPFFRVYRVMMLTTFASGIIIFPSHIFLTLYYRVPVWECALLTAMMGILSLLLFFTAWRCVTYRLPITLWIDSSSVQGIRVTSHRRPRGYCFESAAKETAHV